MDRNVLLAVVLSFAVLAGWSYLVQSPPGSERIPSGEPSYAESPAEPASPLAVPAPEPLVPAPAIAAPEEGGGRVLRVEHPLYTAEVDTLGAALRRWELHDYHEVVDGERRPIVLTTGEKPFDGAAVTPLEGLGIGNLAQVVFDLEGSDPGTLAFRFSSQGVTVRKTYVFDPDTFAFRLRLTVENRSSSSVGSDFGVYWPVHAAPGVDFTEQALVAFHAGGVERQDLRSLGTGGFFGSFTGSPPQRVFDFVGEIDWAGSQTTYFLSVLLPDDPVHARARFVTLEPGKSGVTQIFFDPVQIPPGQAATREFRAYVGPKDTERLAAIGSHVERSIDLGWSWVAPLTQLFGWLLRALYTFIPNYGVAIIVLTVMVRLVTAPLTTKQMRSMERMREIQPRLKELQAKHGDDRQKQSEEMMRLYKQEGVNPLGGCLPMVLQLPVFIGLFYALRSSIELRQAPFFGWIDDLSAPESLFMIPGLDLPVRVLPLVMGLTMILQQRLTPMPAADPMQARMMMTVMPVVMTAVFYQFPSGLVLYWMVSNVLAIAHQRWIGRRMRPKPKARGRAEGGVGAARAERRRLQKSREETGGGRVRS